MSHQEGDPEILSREQRLGHRPLSPEEQVSPPPEDTLVVLGRRHRSLRWVLLTTSLVLLVPFLFMLGSRLGHDPSLVRSPLLGKPAPAFSLPRLDQPGTMTSADLAGTTYIVNFWASWCVPCREETPTLQDFYQRWRTQGVELVGILYSDKVAAAREFHRQFGGNWPLVDDPDGRTAIDYGVFGVPETYVVDGRGLIMAKLVGAVRPGTLEGIIGRPGQGAPVYEQNDQYRRSP